MSISLDKLRLLRRQAGDQTQAPSTAVREAESAAAVVGATSVAKVAEDAANPANAYARSTEEAADSAPEASRLTSLLRTRMRQQSAAADSAIAWVEKIQHKTPQGQQQAHSPVGATSVASSADNAISATDDAVALAEEASRLTSLLRKPMLPTPVLRKPARNDSAIAWVEQIRHKPSHDQHSLHPHADAGASAVVGATSVASSIGRRATPADASARSTEEIAASATDASRLTSLRPTPALSASNPQRSAAAIAPRRIQDSASLRRLLGLRERAIGGVPTAVSRATALDRTIPGEEIAPGLFLIESFLPQSIPSTALSLAFAKRDDEQLDPRDLLFFDTETTGLAGGTGTRAFMIGAADWDSHDIHGDGLRIRQLLMTTMAAETAMLREFTGWLRPTTVFSSYNGRCYDAPLLKTRYRLARQPDPISALDHVDLLFPTRRRYRGVWENCRLATIERQLLKIVREDDLPGSEAPAAWLTYLRGGSARNLRRVADHNHQDVVTLAQLFLRLVEEQRHDELRVDLQLPV